MDEHDLPLPWSIDRDPDGTWIIIAANYKIVAGSLRSRDEAREVKKALKEFYGIKKWTKKNKSK